MKQIIIGILIFLLVMSLVGCGGAPAPDAIPDVEEPEIAEPGPAPVEDEPEIVTPNEKDDIVAIEQVMRDYFEAFSEYDTERIGSLIAEETRETEGTEILMAVVFAQGLNLKFEVTGVAVSVNGDRATAIVTGKSSLSTGDEIYNLVRESGTWKIYNIEETK